MFYEVTLDQVEFDTFITLPINGYGYWYIADLIDDIQINIDSNHRIVDLNESENEFDFKNISGSVINEPEYLFAIVDENNDVVKYFGITER